jgi:tetratricopeptide (TPR) repeat protein
MPYSSSSGKEYISQLINQINPKTVLDVGSGSGTYASFKQPLQHWTAVEIWQPNIEKFNLHSLYDKVICADARNIDIEEYDLVILGDVLEHMTKEQAFALLEKCKRSRYVIVSIPLGYYPQDEFDGNPHEKHITDNWSPEEFVSYFGNPWQQHIQGEIGVFVYRKPLKICVYAISKNEQEFVHRFCSSSKEADLVLIADTGSTDNTVAYAKDCGAQVYNISVKPWRFDKARDTALNLIPGDYDVCISLDLDEVLEPGWRQEIERVWMPETTRLRYKFDWGHNILFYYEKIHHRHGYHWHHPVHEYPRPDGRLQERYAQTDKLLVSHHPDPTKSRGQYLDLLRLAVKEDPHCPRNAFYFARELTFYSLWQEAILALNSYLKMPGSDWSNERCYAMRLLGKSHDSLGEGDQALRWYRQACAEAPNTREPWVDLAMSCYMKEKWRECYYASTMALTITDKQLVYTCDPEVWTSKPHDLAAISSYNLGLYNEAVKYGISAVELSPEDIRLKTNLEHFLLKV